MSQNLQLPLRSVVNGVEWQLYAIGYETCEAPQLSAYFYATSFEHAYVLLADLKVSGTVENCLCEVRRP